jgi:hypothetical protein
VSYKISFENTIHVVKSQDKDFNIPEELFKYGKDKAKIFNGLYNSFNQLLNNI